MIRISRTASKLSKSLTSLMPHTSAIRVRTTPFSQTQQSTGTKGAPPVSIDDLYGLCFLAEPRIRVPQREPRDMFDTDQRLNEVVIYLNGGLHATNDKVTEDFVRHMFEASVIFLPRDASNKPGLRKILVEEAGTEELPQLWVHKKLVGKGAELDNFDRVWELCSPSRRPWPRDGPYRMGFYNKPGVTQSDLIHVQ